MCLQPPDVEELSMISVQLVAKFLFNIGFHTKKILRLVMVLFTVTKKCVTWSVFMSAVPITCSIYYTVIAVVLKFDFEETCYSYYLVLVISSTLSTNLKNSLSIILSMMVRFSSF